LAFREFAPEFQEQWKQKALEQAFSEQFSNRINLPTISEDIGS
jgi:hypothetical protein